MAHIDTFYSLLSRTHFRGCTTTTGSRPDTLRSLSKFLHRWNLQYLIAPTSVYADFQSKPPKRLWPKYDTKRITLVRGCLFCMQTIIHLLFINILVCFILLSLSLTSLYSFFSLFQTKLENYYTKLLYFTYFKLNRTTFTFYCFQSSEVFRKNIHANILLTCIKNTRGLFYTNKLLQGTDQHKINEHQWQHQLDFITNGRRQEKLALVLR